MRVDLLQHFIVGSILGFVAINTTVGIGVWWGFGLCVLVAAAKEVVWDKMLGKGTFDWLDMAYTILPALMFLLTSLNR